VGRRIGWLLALALLTAAEPSRGTLDAFADAVVERARPHLQPARDLDVAVAIAGPWPRLGDDLAALVIARLRALGVRSAERGDGDGAWARAAGYERILHLDLDVGGGRLRASGSVLRVTSSLWAGSVETSAHVYVEMPLDAELRAYLPGVTAPAGRWQARGLPVGDVDLLALDVGDSDRDGRNEVVGATATEVIVWAWDGARFVERRRSPFTGRPAAIMPRAPVVTVSVERGRIAARSSLFAGGGGFEFPGVAASCELTQGVDWFAAPLCRPSGRLPDRFWAVAGLRGGARPVRAAVDPEGMLWVAMATPGISEALPMTVRGVGAQVTVVELDRGEFVATSEPVQAGEADAIVVRALSAGLPVAYRVDRLPGNVRALAAGDVDGDGKAEIVAAVRDRAARRTELWMVN
jgi:hypothetical protein